MGLTMTPNDLRILSTALGFTAVAIQPSEEELHLRATMAKTLALMIEEFCRINVPDAFSVANDILGDSDNPAAIDEAIDRFKVALHENEEARLPQDRKILLQFYDRLQQRKMRWEQSHFYATAPDSLIADNVLKMIDDEIEQDGDAA